MVERLAADLCEAFPDMKGFSPANNMANAGFLSRVAISEHWRTNSGTSYARIAGGGRTRTGRARIALGDLHLHACLKWVMRDYLTNASLRERFGVEKKNKAAASRYIREALEAKVIRPFSEDAPPKLMKYVPFWA